MNLKNGFIEVTIDLYREMKRIKGKNIDKRSKEHISEERNQEILTIICQKRMSVREAAKRFNLARSTIFDWKKASMEGKPLSNRGRPKIVDDKGLEYIKETVKNCYHANSTTPQVRPRSMVNIISRVLFHEPSMTLQKGIIALFEEMELIERPEILFCLRPAYRL